MRSLHVPEDHSIPNNANTNTATGNQQAGRRMNDARLRGSMPNSSETNQSAMRIVKIEVDHGSAAAASTSTMSVLNRRASGLCQADSMNDTVAPIDDRFPSRAPIAQTLLCACGGEPALSFNIMPPAMPTPSTYIHPSWKSTRCELKSEESTFCTTTSDPIQATNPAPRKIDRWASHIV